MDVGRLRHPITIQRATRAPDDSGTPVDTWLDLATVWAEVVAVGGGETFRGRQVHAEASLVIVTRYRSDVNTRMRISYQGNLWGIVYAGDPYGDRRQLRIEAKAAP